MNEEERYAQMIEARVAESGLEGVTVVRGRAGDSIVDDSQDEAYGDYVEANLVQPDPDNKITIVRGPTAPKTPRRAMADRIAAPGSKPVVHDPMSTDARRLAMNAASRVDADATAPGVVHAPTTAPSATQAPVVLAPDARGVVQADFVVGHTGPAPVLATSDSALSAQQEEMRAASAEAHDRKQSLAEKLADHQPATSAEAAVTDTGVTVRADAAEAKAPADASEDHEAKKGRKAKKGDA